MESWPLAPQLAKVIAATTVINVRRFMVPLFLK